MRLAVLFSGIVLHVVGFVQVRNCRKWQQYLCVMCFGIFHSHVLRLNMCKMCVLLLLIQCMHVVHNTFRVRVSVRFCFSVGITVSSGGEGGWQSWISF